MNKQSQSIQKIVLSIILVFISACGGGGTDRQLFSDALSKISDDNLSDCLASQTVTYADQRDRY